MAWFATFSASFAVLLAVVDLLLATFATSAAPLAVVFASFAVFSDSVALAKA